MISYLLKIFSLLLFSVFVIFNFYFIFPGHIENFDGYLSYVIIIGIFYAVYKYFQLDKSSEKAEISLKSIILFFILNLFILCFYFFSLAGREVSSGFGLFFTILLYALLPLVIYIVSFSFGKKILLKIPNKDDFGIFWILELVIGFISFLSLVIIFGIFGFYNLFVVSTILLLFSIFSYKEFGIIFNSFFTTKYTFDIKEGAYLKLISTEFFTIFSFTILATGLISLIRPFPIGWDDLGVYMNFPHLMAEAGNLLSLGAMYSWQTFTGIGYMFGTPVAAFFINISGLFLSFIILIVILSNLIKSVNVEKKSFFNLPIILSTVFISLPMVGFQTTKDMKLDEGLFFITIIALFFLYKYYILLREKKNISILYIFLIGIIVGFSFSIKFTSLLTIVSILGLISYARLGITGFLGYISLFFGIFTIGNLWRMMNVVVNPNQIAGFETTFSVISIVSGIALIFYSILKDKKILNFFLKEVGLFLLGVFVILLPWLGKNISEAYPNITVGTILSGKSDDFSADFSSIHSEEKIKEIKQEKIKERKKVNLITTNEDFLRYFGYEKGILDFVYMPWNLTMQKNQSGEYTNIGFIFLALLPLIFIFLPYRKKYYFTFFIFIAFIQFISYFQTELKIISNSEFTGVSSGSLVGIVTNNEFVFKDLKNNDDIYDIDKEKYISNDVIKSGLVKEEIDTKTKEYITGLINEVTSKEFNSKNLQTKEEYDSLFQKNSSYYIKNFENYFNIIYSREFDTLKKQVEKAYYEELKYKVIDNTTGDNFTFIQTPLEQEDIDYIKKLNKLYTSNSIFTVSNIASLNEELLINNSQKSDIEIINNVWKQNRSIQGKIIDLFANITLPYGYIFIFLGFFIPTIYLLFTLKDGKIIYIFKLNLVFASLFTFLWLISAFGIVWYGIAMYFSFLLMIGLGAFFITSYKKTDDENTYLFKMLGSIIFISIVIIYILNSSIPYTFNNLKKAGYEEFKIGQISQASAIFIYHDDYVNTLFTLNVDETKREQFLNEYISKDIINAVAKIETKDIKEIFIILNKLKASPDFKISANNSLENLYKNIQNPKEEYKNKAKIYRIGTFLKYYISENNNRLLEDSLLFNFGDYIYDEDTNITIDRFKKLGVKYLLVDLNAATIDQSETHDLTKRYEKMLKTFISPNLELVETESVCLKLAIDKYKENNDLLEYMALSTTNHDSYDEYGEKINRVKKRVNCDTVISNLLDSNEISESKYSYLLPYKTYFESNPKTIEKIDSLVGMSYKALFRIK